MSENEKAPDLSLETAVPLHPLVGSGTRQLLWTVPLEIGRAQCRHGGGLGEIYLPLHLPRITAQMEAGLAMVCISFPGFRRTNDWTVTLSEIGALVSMLGFGANSS